MTRKEQIHNYLKSGSFGRKTLHAISRDCNLPKADCVNNLKRLMDESLVNREKLGRTAVYFLI